MKIRDLLDEAASAEKWEPLGNDQYKIVRKGFTISVRKDVDGTWSYGIFLNGKSKFSQQGAKSLDDAGDRAFKWVDTH